MFTLSDLQGALPQSSPTSLRMLLGRAVKAGLYRIVNCRQWGRIEFIHIKRTATSLVEQVMWDNRLQLWRASVNLALQDMRYTRRNMDLVDWEIVNELVG